MHRRRGINGCVVALSWLIAACSKTTADEPSAKSAPVPTSAVSTADHAADAATINRLDSAWMRYVAAKNVDSIMTQYAPEAVTYYPGTPAARGADQIRGAYAAMTKLAISDAKVISNKIEFSDDGSMAVDHGISTMTAAEPGSKPSTMLGAYVNVWRKSGGEWKILVDMSEPTSAPKK
jgi:uncharacterized protein (TIGR02246 family)